MTDTITIRVENDTKKILIERAKKQGIATSRYASKLIKDSLLEQERIDIKIDSMSNEILQLEAMLSVMLAFEKEVASILLGRTQELANGKTKELIDMIKKNKEQANKMVENILKKAENDYTNGSNIWGTVKKTAE